MLLASLCLHSAAGWMLTVRSMIAEVRRVLRDHAGIQVATYNRMRREESQEEISGRHSLPVWPDI